MVVKIQQTFLKPNGQFGVCRMMIRNPDTILNSNPRGLGCIINGTVDTTECRTKTKKNFLKNFGIIKGSLLGSCIGGF